MSGAGRGGVFFVFTIIVSRNNSYEENLKNKKTETIRETKTTKIKNLKLFGQNLNLKACGNDLLEHGSKMDVVEALRTEFLC